MGSDGDEMGLGPFLGLELKTDQNAENVKEISDRKGGLESLHRSEAELGGSHPFLGTILLFSGKIPLKYRILEKFSENSKVACSSDLCHFPSKFSPKYHLQSTHYAETICSSKVVPVAQVAPKLLTQKVPGNGLQSFEEAGVAPNQAFRDDVRPRSAKIGAKVQRRSRGKTVGLAYIPPRQLRYRV